MLCALLASTSFEAPALAEAEAEARFRPPPLPPEYLTEDDGWVKLGYHPSAREQVRMVQPRLTEIRGELRARLGAQVLDRVEIRIAALDAEMSRLAPTLEVIDREAGSEAAGTEDHELRGLTHGGASFASDHLVIVSVGPNVDGGARDLETTMRYHLARLALADALHAPSGAVGSDVAAKDAQASEPLVKPVALDPIPTIPIWFRDGFALQFSHEAEGHRSSGIMLTTLRDHIPHIADLEKGRSDPADETEAAFAADFARFVSESQRGHGMEETVLAMRRGADLDHALATAFGSDPASVDRAWRRDVAKRFALVPVIVVFTLLWVALSLFAWARKLRRARALRAASSFLGARPIRTFDADAPKEVIVRSKRVPAGFKAISVPGLAADEAVVTTATVEARDKVEVPKIEHDGGWHTLH